MIKDFEKTIGNMADKLKTAFIGSVDTEGYPNIKAMLQPRKREGIKTFYFTTNTSSMRVGQYMHDNKACVYFCDNRFFRGVLLRGLMEVLTDTSSKEMIWRDGDTQYYSEGVTDPDYCVLKFTALSGRYYSNFKSEDFKIE
ncbi:MAG: pyridoxamine 5'-phosphate oxidase family protein [Muribaculaceae bacterium]|nr:pyridoxamine 5'-phosphate oxidase family protein [Muribaculaceae bacterium]